MKTPLLILAVSAAFAQPVLAGTSAVADAQAPGAIERHLEKHIIINGLDVLADAAGARATADSWRAWADEFARDMESSFSYLFSDRVGRGKVVKGAPYSAQAVSETNRTLADGNVISKKSTSRVYRDAEGRTRQETLSADGKARSVYIHDPVAGESYTLMPERKRAIVLPRMSMPSFDVKTDEKGRKKIIVGGKEIVVDGKEVTVDGNKRIVIKTHEDDDGDGTNREEVRVQVIRMGDQVTKEITVIPGAPHAADSADAPDAPDASDAALAGTGSMHLDSAIARGKVTTGTLAAKEIEGVKAEGKSSTTVIAAGEIGNRNPIQVTSETWTSPELQVTLYSRSMDPRYGETLYKLTNIRRGDPQADLFKVPDDYKKSGRGAREGRG